MRRFRFSRRSAFRRNVRRARPIVRAVQGITLAKRIQLTAGGKSIPDVTAAHYDNPLTMDLIKCQESMDEEVESVGDTTTVAQVPLYSRVLAFKLNFTVLGPASASVTYRWVLYKKPDGEAQFADLTDTNFHVSDDNPSNRERRKFVLAKGMMYTNASTGVTPLRIFVKKAAMRRISPLRENDTISLSIAKDSTGISGDLHGFGTIWVRANA